MSPSSVTLTAASRGQGRRRRQYVNVLGANTARQCLDAGVIDEILVCIAPVLLGDGVRLFDRPRWDSVKLERLSLTHTPRATNLWLRVVK